ncbi:MAG: glutathione S-transferase N-terminal domain-containing protein [Actinomycetota bacterium]
MKLRYSTTSPFARKCVITAMECGLDGRMEIVPTSPWAADTDLPRDNPLCKIPCLVLEGGESLYDSAVICEYLDSQHDGAKLFPPAGGARWAALRLQALADGIMDAAVAKRIETSMRPEDKRWSNWVDRQEAAVKRGLDALDQDCGSWGDTFQIGQITVVCALDYIAFRNIVDWRSGRPALAAWYDKVAARPSVARSVPKE